MQVALLLPFPRLAALQLAQRIAEAYRQAMRLHAVLAVAFVQPEVPTALDHLHNRYLHHHLHRHLRRLLHRHLHHHLLHRYHRHHLFLQVPIVLHHRTLTLADRLEGSLHNLQNLAKASRWELGLLDAQHAATLRRHAELLHDLAHNLQVIDEPSPSPSPSRNPKPNPHPRNPQVRTRRRNTFSRQPLHKRAATASRAILYESVTLSAKARLRRASTHALSATYLPSALAVGAGAAPRGVRAGRRPCGWLRDAPR